MARISSFGGVSNIISIPKSLTNLVTNGDLQSATGWDGSTLASFAVASNEATCLANAQNDAMTQTISTVSGNIYFAKALVKAASVNVKLSLGTGLSAHAGNSYYQELTLLFTATGTSHALSVLDANTSGWANYYVKYLVAIDLTAGFGTKKEPALWQCSMFLKDYDPTNRWFDGTKSLMLNYSPKRMTNLVANGNFALGTQGFDGSSLASFTVASNIATCLADAQNDNVYKAITTVSGRKYYYHSYFKSTSALVKVGFGTGVVAHSGSNAYERLSAVFTATTTTHNFQVIDTRASGFDSFFVTLCGVIDLTTIFGSGNEPTAAQMDDLLAKLGGWFDGDTCVPTSWLPMVTGGSGGSLITRREERLSLPSGDPKNSIVTDGLVLWLDGRDFKNSPATSYWMDRCDGNHAQTSGFAYTSASGSDGAGGVKFDGVDDCCKTSISPLFSGQVSFTMIIDTYLYSDEVGVEVVCGFGTADVYKCAGLYILNGIHIYFTSGGVDFYTGFDIDITRHQFIIKYDGANVFVLRDGIICPTGLVSYSINLTNPYVEIGAYFDNTMQSKPIVKSFQLYNRALTDSEILQNYQASIS